MVRVQTPEPQLTNRHEFSTTPMPQHQVPHFGDTQKWVSQCLQLQCWSADGSLSVGVMDSLPCRIGILMA